jgi:thiol-disulfide isomerase/thioredoxin
MKLGFVAILYTVLALGVNTSAMADDLAALREGDMKKLVLHETPINASMQDWQLADGAGTGNLGDYAGQYVLLNFWATWCAPCRAEMPTLSALQSEFGGAQFQVVTLATGRNTPAGIVKFFDQSGIANLPRHQDPKQSIAREMAVLGLPITVIIDPDGFEIARLRGDADWHSDSARAIIAALLQGDG